ncbi:MAG: hypothetical protein HY343_07315 [Lentisphaerae bacterium]|nr:hypothetical protein [Lentisphaerota bacterium]
MKRTLRVGLTVAVCLGLVAWTMRAEAAAPAPAAAPKAEKTDRASPDTLKTEDIGKQLDMVKKLLAECRKELTALPTSTNMPATLIPKKTDFLTKKAALLQKEKDAIEAQDLEQARQVRRERQVLELSAGILAIELEKARLIEQVAGETNTDITAVWNELNPVYDELLIKQTAKVSLEQDAITLQATVNELKAKLDKLLKDAKKQRDEAKARLDAEAKAAKKGTAKEVKPKEVKAKETK